MITIRFLTCILTLVPLLAFAESNYWGHIEELAKFNTPQGNPQLENYLKGLTSDQTIQAVREYCTQVQNKFPQDQWGPSATAVGIIMAFYENKEAALTDERLYPLVKCIVDNKESPLFRETLTRILRQKYWRQLTEQQRAYSRRQFLEVVTDIKSPTRLRTIACREIELAVAEDYKQIVYTDKNVQPLRSDKAKWRNLDDLVRKGEVRLDPETRESLKSVRDEIANITPTLAKLSQDAAESPEVKNRAQAALKTFSDLPVVAE